LIQRPDNVITTFQTAGLERRTSTCKVQKAASGWSVSFQRTENMLKPFRIQRPDNVNDNLSNFRLRKGLHLQGPEGSLWHVVPELGGRKMSGFRDWIM
jgi:hypothetical protein